MGKISEGQIMEDFTFRTSTETGLLFSKAATGKKTVVLFLRYYGCTLCRLDMHVLREKYPDISGAGGQVFVVLQSAPELIEGETRPDPFPFTIICDPRQELYHRFEMSLRGAERTSIACDAVSLASQLFERRLGRKEVYYTVWFNTKFS